MQALARLIVDLVHGDEPMHGVEVRPNQAGRRGKRSRASVAVEKGVSAWTLYCALYCARL